MITKNDCMSILVRLEDKGVNINPYMKKLVISNEPPIEVLKFIAQNQGIEVINFYEMLRKKHNQKKSKLYLNILKEQETEEDIVTTLVCLLTQITLYGNKLYQRDLFYKEVRAEEISRVINDYFKTGNITQCAALLKLIKIDLLVLEHINNHRE